MTQSSVFVTPNSWFCVSLHAFSFLSQVYRLWGGAVWYWGAGFEGKPIQREPVKGQSSSRNRGQSLIFSTDSSLIHSHYEPILQSLISLYLTSSFFSFPSGLKPAENVKGQRCLTIIWPCPCWSRLQSGCRPACRATRPRLLSGTTTTRQKKFKSERVSTVTLR